MPGLGRQAIDQVNIDVVKPDVSGIFDSILCLLVGMTPADHAKEIIICRLQAEGKPVDPFSLHQLQGPPADAVGIALHSDLGICAHIAVSLEHIQHFRNPVCPVIAGRTSAEVDGIHLVIPDGIGRLLQMGKERFMILRHQIIAPGKGIEVTVAALAGTEGNVNIDSQEPSSHT